MIISQKKLAELLARETADIRRKMEAWRDEAENQKNKAHYFADKLNKVETALDESAEELQSSEMELAEYKDAIGDITEALNSISPTIRLNAIKQIRERIERLNVGK